MKKNTKIVKLILSFLCIIEATFLVAFVSRRGC